MASRFDGCADPMEGRPSRCALEPAERSNGALVALRRGTGCTQADARDLCAMVLDKGITALDGAPLDDRRVWCLLEMAGDGAVTLRRTPGCSRTTASSLCVLVAADAREVIDCTDGWLHGSGGPPGRHAGGMTGNQRARV